MSTCWLRQKQLAFNATFIDYITCTHFAVLPNNNNNKNTEVLYIGCNNGNIIACDVSSLPPASATTTTTSSSQKPLDVGSHLYLLYTHQTVSSPSSSQNKSNNQQQQQPKLRDLSNINDDDAENDNIINDEVSGCSVFALCQYETLFASCGDDHRCVISMMNESHPPFFEDQKRKEEILNTRRNQKVSSNDNNKNKNDGDYYHHESNRNNNTNSIQDLQPPLVAVIEEASPIRCVQLFGGRKSWVDEFPDDEAASVYCAAGSEDGFLRVYRVIIGDDNNNAGAADSKQISPFSFSYWSEKTSNSIQLLWVVSMAQQISLSSSSCPLSSSSSSSFKSSTLDDDVLELVVTSSSSEKTDTTQNDDNSKNSNNTPFICSLVYDEDTELFLVGTQSGVCLCDCLPKTNPMQYRGKQERDLGRRATNESWMMNGSVWALSAHELKKMTVAVTSSEEDLKEKKANQISSSSESFGRMPLRSLKSKYLNLYHSARSIGTVVEVVESQEQGQLSMLKIMFPSITIRSNTLKQNKKKSHHQNADSSSSSNDFLMLPQEAVRRVCRPRYFLTTSGGPYFATSLVPNNDDKNNKTNNYSELTCVVAGAATNGEVLVINVKKCGSNSNNNLTNSSSSSLNGDVDISVLCRFRAGQDLIKSVTCHFSDHNNNHTLLLCGSYDGTISDWVLTREETEDKNQQQQKRELIPLRRCVQLVASADGVVDSNKNNSNNKASTENENFSRYENLLTISSNGDDTFPYHHQAISSSTEMQNRNSNTSSSSGVGTLFFFKEAGVLFSSCLFERTMQTFVFGRKEGPFDLPDGMMFDGYKTVRVDDERLMVNNGRDDTNNNNAGVPDEVLDEGFNLKRAMMMGS